MNKNDLVYELEGLVRTKTKAEQIVNTIFNEIVYAIKRGERVSLHGFGTFKLAARAENKVRNPHTGEELISPAHNVVKFKPAKSLKEAVR